MIYVVIGIAYLLLLALLVRFFQAVHRWDEEIELMETHGRVRSNEDAKAKAA